MTAIDRPSDRPIDRLRRLLLHPWLKWLALPAAAIAVVGTVLSQSAPPPTPLITLASEPLYARGARAKPTLTLALSVEFPTVGAQYLSTPGATTDSTYSAANQYIGYFDSESCYVYNYTPAPTEIPSGGTAADAKRFDRLPVPASAHTCGGVGFSGNFMNWASSSAIDILRYGLTGGDRVVDLPALTILQRAVLPQSFWNSTNFPSKQLPNADAVGALPTTFLGTYTGTVYVANCLNHITFGKSASGNCGSPGDNSSLGTSIGGGSRGPAQAYPGAPAAAVASFGGTQCAVEDANSLSYPGYNVAYGNTTTCAFSGLMTVLYGIGSGAAPNGNGGTGWLIQAVVGGTPCSYSVFGSDPAYGTYKKCYVRAYNASTDPPAPAGSSALFTDDAFFYSRVSVCASSGTTLTDPRSDLCLRYPSGQYKPVGNLQKYSDRLRVAAFGYLNDSTGNPNERYGGVLRAPMKYVGQSYYDSNFALVSGTNPKQEWDPTTGIFIADPDGNATSSAPIKSGPSNTGPYLSGVTNYLNQFGRTGTPGLYKTYDPVGELYYESLRYLQGLPPTPQATAGMTAYMQDGYPVFTSWIDPHPAVVGMSTTDPNSYACVRNNIVGIGDVNTHNDKSFPGNFGSAVRTANEGSTSTNGFPSGRAANVAGNEQDYYFWTQVVGGFESNNAVSYTDGKGAAQTTSNFNPPNSARWGMENQNIGADGAAYFLAGAAYWANTHDIRGSGWTSWPSTSDPRRPGMRVTTYWLDVNEGGAGNNDNNRHNNQFFLSAKYGGFTDVTGTGNPFKNTIGGNTNDNWQDSANPGEAKTYFLSSSASSVLAALTQIFETVAEQANSIAGGAVSTQRLSSVPGFIYQAQFDPATWTGDLKAYTSTADPSGVVTIATTASWQAALELDLKAALSTSGGSRNIMIGKTTATSAATATPFDWGSVDADVKTALLTPPYAAPGTPLDPTATGQARLAYLRGDRTNEAPSGFKFRTRTHVLGDIVNSGVVYVGAPSQDISDASYAAFQSTNAGRKHALYVGGNDGMLHAFDPDHGTGTGPSHSGGDELFAYIPSTMIPKLGALTSVSYAHQSYVDGSQAVAEAKVGSGMSSGTWKTVLVGATGGGSQSVYALDVSNPAAFDATKVMWEFTDKDDPDLGNVIGHPQILKIRTTAASAAADYQYFAVFAGGVDNYANDGSFSTTGNPALFLLDLSKAAGSPWVLGSNYFKISFPASTSVASGMIGYSARLGTAGAVAAIYAGDLQGNLWKLDFTQSTFGGKSDFNLSGTSGSFATLNKLSFFKNSSGNAMPMYIAKSAAGVLQPITMDPALIYSYNRQLIVSFGTGKFLENSDNVQAGAPQQTVYAILDNNSAAADSTGSVNAAIAGRTRLAPGTLSAGTITVPAFTWGRSTADVDPTGLRSGWYFDFTTAGERQISDFSVLAGQLILGSVIPALNSCDNGSGNLYITDLATGASTVSVSNVGILGQPYVLPVNGAASTTLTSATGLSQQTTNYQVILMGSGGLSKTLTTQPSTTHAGRLSWREISNYQYLRNAP